jgi:exonuclease SbcC
LIPLSLRVRNFMPYRGQQPAFDFRGIHTACICGSNGSGKSSIIDAITWALWGKTRAKSDDDLITQNEHEMDVTFDFSVSEQEYRVIRKRSRTKKSSGVGVSALEFQLLNNGLYKTITGDTISNTQQQIIDTLHMDYDTFINSAFLRQGHAGEFTRQRPNKRKEVLAGILGLAVYDKLEENAKNKARHLESETDKLEYGISRIEQELDNEDTINTELGVATEELSALLNQLTTIEIQLKDLRARHTTLEVKNQQYTQLKQSLAQNTIESQRWQSRLKDSTTLTAEYENIVNQSHAINKGFAAFSETKKLKEELDIIYKHINTLNPRRHSLEKEVIQIRERLIVRHGLLQKEVERLANEASIIEHHQKELSNLKPFEVELKELEEKIKRKEKVLGDNKGSQAKLNFHQQSLQQDIEEIDKKIYLLSASEDSVCPLCEKPLAEDERQVVRSKLEAEKKSLTTVLKSNTASASALADELKVLQNSIATAITLLTQKKNVYQQKLGTVNQRLVLGRDNITRLQEFEKVIKVIEEQLAMRDYAKKEQAVLDALEKEIAELEYDAPRHERITASYEELKVFSTKIHKLSEAQRLLVQLRQNIAQAQESLAELSSQQITQHKLYDTLSKELLELPSLNNTLASVEADYKVQSLKSSAAQETVGRFEEKLERLSKLKIKRKEDNRILTKTQGEIAVYKELAKAFGKKGIQAILIGTALPEIENEANHLLERMTEGRFRIRLKPQRTTKKGDLQETLDIFISDELGTRSYEMFSGGEAFRIDFAIRIALSKLLANRAGAPLPTLIIDEGFGTQDSLGIDRLKEAISSIQQDFKKIFVITHLEELKDSFPTRIEVTKTVKGSLISLC